MVVVVVWLPVIGLVECLVEVVTVRLLPFRRDMSEGLVTVVLFAALVRAMMR